MPEMNLKRAVSLVTRMMAIPGQSGREARILHFITNALRKAGLPSRAMRLDQVHRKSPNGGETGNLIVRLEGTTRQQRRLLMAHVDTVPVCVGSRPVRRGAWIRSADHGTALGADNRSGAAAVLNAVLAILAGKLHHPPLTILWTVQEEVGLIGARFVALANLGRPKLVFNFDSGDPSRLVIGATGAYRGNIDIEGTASHAGVHPELGVSAITIASLAIAQLQKDGYLGAVRKGRRTGTSNIGFIEGGQATNVVAPRARLTAEVRSHDPRFRKMILDRFRTVFRSAAEEVRNESGRAGKVRFDFHLDYEAFKLGRREPCIVAARKAVRACAGGGAGIEPLLVVVDGGLDANWLTRRGLPTVTLGAGQHGAHTVDEALHVSEFEIGCRAALRLATGTEDA